jgi:thiamine biosynthesis lipoprotein
VAGHQRSGSSQASDPNRSESSQTLSNRTQEPVLPSDAGDSAGEAPLEAPPVRPDHTIFAEAELMGTSVSINLWLAPQESAAKAGADMRDAFYEIARLEAIASEWQASSDLTRFNNHAGGEPLELPTELVEILKRSREISEATNGRFDATFHGVGRLWSFKPGSVPPTQEAIERALPLINWRDIEIIDATHARLRRKGMAVGLGAIAKGYAVDAASKLLRSRGWKNHIVEGGGDTYVAGTKNGQPWMVGIQDPDGKGSAGVLPSSDEAVVTSGNYERFFVHEGIKYAHIIDPKTGRPLPFDQSLRSVTLVASNAADADAYCTAVTVMGPEEGMRFVESHPELAAIMIDAKGNFLVSSRLKERFRLRTGAEASRQP